MTLRAAPAPHGRADGIVPPVGHAADWRIVAPGHGRRARIVYAVPDKTMPHSYRPRRTARTLMAVAGAALLATGLAACGKSGSSGTTAPPTVSAGAAGCAAVPDTTLVVLTDDKHLQASDNLVPAINKSVNNPALIAALNAVSKSLDTTKLIALNKSVDVDRKSAADAAAAFAATANFTSGLTKGPGGKITVGAAGFNESLEVANLYKIALQSIGYTVTVQQKGNRELYEPLLEQNKLQVIPEYAATLTTFLAGKQKSSAAPTGDIAATMTALKSLGPKANLVFGDPSDAADQNAFAVTKATATKYGLTTLTDFGAKCSGKATSLAGPAECPKRPFCEPGLQQTYNIQFGGGFKNMGTDAGGPVTKKALTDGQATIGLVFSSDSSLGS
jgi:osmoprotectant transport system substrate-binding protein